MSAVVSLLSRLIASRTDNPGPAPGGETALAELLAEELRSRGADEVRLLTVPRGDSHTGAYVIATWGRPRLLVNAHLDTVPVNAGWSGDPFTARVVGAGDEARVVGLGAADTKGAIAAILCALEESRPRDCAVVFSGDEESSGSCVRALLSSGALGTIRYAIVCEPTGLRPGTRHRGILTLEARVKGQGGHSSLADRLPRPLASLARLATRLDDWGLSHAGKGPPGYPGMCVNVAKLDGGVAFNVVPEAAHLTVSLRPPPGSDLAAVKSEILQLAAQACPEAETAWSLDNPAFATRDLDAFRRWLGPRVEEPRDLGFWTEAAVLSEAGLDAVVLGPGEIAQAHGPDEWVAVTQLEGARALFAGVFAATRANGSG